MDYETPLFDHHLAIRLFQADYEYMHVNWGPDVLGGRANLNSARLSAGLVLHAGSIAPPPQLTVACSANPTSVFPGDPVTVTATVGSQHPKLGVVVSISGDGISGANNSATATVNTADLHARAAHRQVRRQGRQAGQGRREALAGSHAVDGHLHGEGIRAADDLLLGEPDDHQAGRQRHHHGHGHQPAEPPADLHLLGLRRAT